MENFVSFGIKAEKFLPNFVTDVFTKNICTKIGRSRKHANKLRFAKTYKIDWKQATKCKKTTNLDSCVKKFYDLDDLFSRKIDPVLTRPESTGPTDIVSPAESYVRQIKSQHSKFTIKGAKYTLEKLLNKPGPHPKSTLFIFRLAPEQYHRIHSPIKATITDITELGGTYKSVNPILLEDIPVLQENYRKIINFNNGIIMIAVGATCIGSVILSVKKGSKVKHGDDMGTFGFGGSTIVLVVPEDVKMAKHITTNEQLIKPGEFIGKFIEQ
jgi:phosphatidylserine decarboxylase